MAKEMRYTQEQMNNIVGETVKLLEKYELNLAECLSVLSSVQIWIYRGVLTEEPGLKQQLTTLLDLVNEQIKSDLDDTK